MSSSSRADRHAIRFMLDGRVHEVAGVAPTVTVLEYLRDTLRRTGTKEGCAEGDCGACTVVIADLCGDEVRFRSVNSCIQFLPVLDGKALFTVESLKKLCGGALHPVQQAMIQCHGSQCGFCTPGFVMSLFHLFIKGGIPTRPEIDNALSGNLCRCTGYRPIIDAASEMFRIAGLDTDNAPVETGMPRGTDALRVELRAKLKTIAPRGRLMLGDGAFRAPDDIDDLAELAMEHPQAVILSGGTDVGLWVSKQLRDIPQMIYLGNVRELQRIHTAGGAIEIGAAVDLESALSALVGEYPELREIHRRFASPPVRNAGTLCGNIANASPIGDSMPALIVLGAELVLRRGSDTRCILLEDFYSDYRKTALQKGEFIEAVRVPLRTPGTVFRSYKVGKRYDQDISAVCGAFRFDIEDGVIRDVRLCFGGVAAIPRRAASCEKQLLGKPWIEETIRGGMSRLAAEFTPISDMRATAAYRTGIAARLLWRCFLEVQNPGLGLRVGDIEPVAFSA